MLGKYTLACLTLVFIPVVTEKYLILKKVYSSKFRAATDNFTVSKWPREFWLQFCKKNLNQLFDCQNSWKSNCLTVEALPKFNAAMHPEVFIAANAHEMLQFMVNKVPVQWEVCYIHVHQQLAHSANACWTLNTPNLTTTLPGSRFGKHQIAMLRHSNVFSPQLYKYFCILRCLLEQAELCSCFNKTRKTAGQEFKPANNNRPQFKSIYLFFFFRFFTYFSMHASSWDLASCAFPQCVPVHTE